MNIKNMASCLFFLMFLMNIAEADDAPAVDFGFILGSRHVDGSLKTVPYGYNQNNIGGVIYLENRKNIIPFVEEFSLAYVHKNSFGDNSLVFLAHKKLWKKSWIQLDFSFGGATGYGNYVTLAKELGFLPMMGLRTTILRHFEVGLMPSSLVNSQNTNVLVFSWRF